MANGDNTPDQTNQGAQPAPPLVPPDIGTALPAGIPQQAPALAPPPPISGGRMPMPGAGLPNIIQLLAGVLKPQQGTVTPGQGPQRPNSRLEVFENFLGQFLTSFSAGLGQSGQRGAEGKGFAAAVNAPYQRSLQQQEFGLQERGVESQEGLRAAQEQFNRSRATQFDLVPMTVMGPDGNPQQVMVPQNSVGRIQAAIQGQQGKIISAQDHDQTLKDIAALKNPTIQITSDVAQSLGLPTSLVGNKLSAADIHRLLPGTKTISTAEGIYLANAANPNAIPIRIGSNPTIAAANIGANAKITVQQMRNDQALTTNLYNKAGEATKIMYSKAMDGINQWAREEERTGYLSFGADPNTARQAFEQELIRRKDAANQTLIDRTKDLIGKGPTGTGPAGVPTGTAAAPNRIPKANPQQNVFGNIVQQDPALQKVVTALSGIKDKGKLGTQIEGSKTLTGAQKAILKGYYGIQ